MSEHNHKESKNAILKILACGYTQKNPNTYFRMDTVDIVDTVLQIKGILSHSAQGASTAELWNKVNFYYRPESQERSCCGRLTSYFSSHCPQVPHMDKLRVSNIPSLGQDWATPQSPEQGENRVPISTSIAGNSLLFGLNCPDSFPLILFFLLLYPITITTQIVNALQRSFSSLPIGHQRNQKTSHQNPKKISWIHLPKKQELPLGWHWIHPWLHVNKSGHWYTLTTFLWPFPHLSSVTCCFCFKGWWKPAPFNTLRCKDFYC